MGGFAIGISSLVVPIYLVSLPVRLLGDVPGRRLTHPRSLAVRPPSVRVCSPQHPRTTYWNVRHGYPGRNAARLLVSPFSAANGSPGPLRRPLTCLDPPHPGSTTSSHPP